MSDDFSRKVLSWFDRHGRHDLPWQLKQTPYAVWVSEVMLQQTQVSTVIPYYRRFMRRFPSIKSLSEADIDEVLSYWSGLGYYARGRNLHRCAQLLTAQYHGRFPNTVEEVSQLPGIGRSTAGAILSLSRNLSVAILDGNVKRVLARYFAVEGAANSTALLKSLWEIAERLMPMERCRDYNQGMMDLGALVCTRSNPRCDGCPLSAGCEAYKRGEQSVFPNKKKKAGQRLQKAAMLLILQNERHDILLEKRAAVGIWGGLWSFPECRDVSEIEAVCHRYDCCVLGYELLAEFKHVFSHFDLWITPVSVKVKHLSSSLMDSASQIWYKKGESLPGGIPAVINRFMVSEVVVV